jgi:predicted nucleic acid-binding protein
MIKEYLLDANIVIRIWNEYPQLLNTIENRKEIDFKISQDIAGELAIKEFRNINGVHVLTDKFLKLLGHIINNDGFSLKGHTENSCIKQDSNNNMYFVEGYKISHNDYSLIDICKNHKEYILVTEDKKILESAKIVLDPSRVLTFNEFLKDLNSFNVL